MFSNISFPSSDCNFVGSRKGANGSIEDLKAAPPTPRAWVNPAMISAVVERLASIQQRHSRYDLADLLKQTLFDAANERYRVVWSKNMITCAGVSRVKRKNGGDEVVLHLRDGEEERGENPRFQRKILEVLYTKGGRGRESVEDFLYLTFVHEASEIHQRMQEDTLQPNIKSEIRAIIEEAKAYFALPVERQKALKQLYKLLDETHPLGKRFYSSELECFEGIKEEGLGTIEGLLSLIDYIVQTPDYQKESRMYHDDRTRLQLARSLFVDILHDFAGGSRADRWVRRIEHAGTFAQRPVKFKYTENSAALSKQAHDVLVSAARNLATLRPEEAEAVVLPGRSKKKGAIESFNTKVGQLDDLKKMLEYDEVLSIPQELREVLEDNTLNRHFSWFDDVGIYHSLNLSRLDLRGLNLNSGDDQRTTNDRERDINHHKDERADLRGAHIVGSDISGRANFSGAQLDFVIACFSDLSEIIFTRAKAIGMVLYGANANEAQFERAKLTALDARGMSANFARIQMKETDINGMKVWQSDVPNWQRAYVDISKKQISHRRDEAANLNRSSLKAELDFLDDSFLDELDAIEDVENYQAEENWIELREVAGQLEFLKGRGVVFYSRDSKLEYSD
jgi:uncharacterized protein YjbI with pentapeptide repeats